LRASAAGSIDDGAYGQCAAEVPVKAVVLVGGEGTRLRPLTETIPKPLIPLVDRAFLHHVLDHLAQHGVDEVVLSSAYLEGIFRAFLDERGEGTGPAVTWITEDEPLGTGGAVANAARVAGFDEPFLVLNGDILTDLDLGALVASHRDRGAVATIALTPVEDARPFGLVARDEVGRVQEFREKPAERVPGVVNAGTYVLDPVALGEVPTERAVSIEREVFPGLIGTGEPVFGFVSDAYWMDLGTPEKYLEATFDVLEGRVAGLSYAAPFVGEGASVSPLARLGLRVVVCGTARVEEQAVVEESVLLPGSVVEEAAHVQRCIVGPGARVGRHARLRGAVLAEASEVGARTSSDGARVGAGMLLAE
jgi:mannose-1-phosphate guanylyltransferase